MLHCINMQPNITYLFTQKTKVCCTVHIIIFPRRENGLKISHDVYLMYSDISAFQNRLGDMTAKGLSEILAGVLCLGQAHFLLNAQKLVVLAQTFRPTWGTSFDLEKNSIANL